MFKTFNVDKILSDKSVQKLWKYIEIYFLAKDEYGTFPYIKEYF